MPTAEPPSPRARRLAAPLAIFLAAGLLGALILPWIEPWVLAKGSPEHFYAYSTRDGLWLLLRCAWLLGLAWVVALVLLPLHADDSAAGDLPGRAWLPHALRRAPSLLLAVLLRGAVVILFAIPAALGLAAAGDPGLSGAPPASALEPAPPGWIRVAAALALLVAAWLWARLALVEAAAVLDAAPRPIAASWSATGRRWWAGAVLLLLAWLPVLVEFAGSLLALPSRTPAPVGSLLLDLAPRLAWAPYTLLLPLTAPRSPADWVWAVVRWVYLAGYLVIVARLGRTPGVPPLRQPGVDLDA